MRAKSSRRKVFITAAAGCILAGMLAIADHAGSKTDALKRAEPGEGSLETEYILNAGNLLKDYTWKVTAEERRYTKKEKKEVIQKAEKELEEKILGENKSPEEINRDLYLPETLQNGAVEAVYSFSDSGIFNWDGTIRRLPDKKTIVVVSAEMKCQGETSIYEFGVQAVPEKKTKKEQLTEEISAALKKENQKTGKDNLRLPKEAGGIPLLWEQKSENRSLPVLLLSLAAAGCIPALEKEKERKERQEREKQLQMEYPHIISKMILLLGAGMNPGTVWKKIAESYQRQRDTGKVPIKPAYEEMLKAVHEMQEGIGEVQAYRNFGERCGIAEYRKLSAILVQNVKMGNAQIQKILELEKAEAYEKHKTIVKTAGEEAGTKLLFPMLLMLLIVLVMIMVPAGMSMNM